MSGRRLSLSAEAARAAALQAEFNEKKWVWVPDDKEGYLSGWVMSEDGEFGDVMMASGSEVCVYTVLWIKSPADEMNRLDVYPCMLSLR